jgi:tetraprenyl-beta-curcumene synthase
MREAIAIGALLRALALHRRRLLPVVRGQQAIWRGAAELVPDAALREAAISSLRDKGRNAEATGAFAILAPRAGRRSALRAMTAFQTAVDYLDTLGERSDSTLEDGLRLHGALLDAVPPDGVDRDWYGRNGRGEDGGYLAGLVAACRRELASLPSAGRLGPELERAARRCGEGQSHTHAAARGDASELEEWARGLPTPPGYLWWEAAAGASSSVAVHALIAAAADARSEVEEARRIDAAYFPALGALTVLLDDLVDREQDAAAGEHNYLAYCPSAEAAARRLGFLADRAAVAVRGLRRSADHAAILDGVVGFYLAAPGAGTPYAEPVCRRMLASSRPSVRLVMAAMRHGQLADA